MLRTVVCGVDDNRILGQPHIVQRFQDDTDIAIVLQHTGTVIVGFTRVLLDLAEPFVSDPGVEVHTARV